MDPQPDQPERTIHPRLFRVGRNRRELRDTVTLELSPTEGMPLSFSAGQFNMLYMFGIGEVPISCSGNPLDPAPLTHTVRAAGAATRAICALKRGQSVGVRGPFGAGWPLDRAEGKDVVLIAGGIGLAPLRPAVHQIIGHRERYGRVTLLVGARTPADLLYESQLKEWRGHFDLAVHVTVDAAANGWRSDVGVVTTLISRAGFDPTDTVAMVCGPEVMMRFCANELRARGVRAEDIYLSLERNMKCAIGVCGHCQFGPTFVCKDGPVFPLSRIERLFRIREV